VLPDGVESTLKAELPPYNKLFPSPLKIVAVVIVEAQDKNPEEVIAQLPLEDFNVKPVLPPLWACVTVNVAHVPDVYHVPPEMMQPFWAPLEVITLRKPVPAKLPTPEPPVEVGCAAVVVVVGEGEGWTAPDFGKYLMPVEGQVELLPIGSEGWKVPSCTEPCTL
jgi:hypothetical protein